MRLLTFVAILTFPLQKVSASRFLFLPFLFWSRLCVLKLNLLSFGLGQWLGERLWLLITLSFDK